MTVDLPTPSLVGARVLRKEDRRLLSGGGRYLDDLTPHGTLHLRLVRSPFAAALITSRPQFSDFLPPPQGALLFTGDEVEVGITADVDMEAFQSSKQPALARQRVRYAGEPVAAVLHEDPYAAEDAAESVEVDYEPTEAVTSIDEALRPGAPLIHEDWSDNAFMRWRQHHGDIGEAQRRAALVVRRTFRTGRQAGIPLECRGALAVPEPGGGGVTLWSSTQIPHLVRTYVAAELGMPENQLRVRAPDVGGGFGVKGHVFAEEALVTWLALQLGRPVKWVEDRREHLVSSIHAREHRHTVEAYVDDSGKILGLKAQLLVDAGAYSVYPWTARSDSGMAAKVLSGPYDIPNQYIEDVAVATNKCPLGTYRGVGRPSAVFTMERLMDEIAREIDLDPVEIRRRNVITEFPFTTANGLLIDSGSYLESMELACKAVDYESQRAEQSQARQQGRRVGIGIAVYNEQTAHGTADFEVRKTPIAAGYESVEVEIDPQGKVVVHTGLQSHGQGMETTLAQAAAAELGVGVEDVTVIHGDSDAPHTTGTWGSRGAALGGGATMLAARRLRAKLLQIAAHHFEIAEEDLEIQDGRVSVRGTPDLGVTIQELAFWATRRPARLPDGMEPGLVETAFLDGPPRGAFSNACHLAVVEVDPGTAKVEILRYIVVEDCGTMLNPMVVDGQVHGGVAQGIGSALLEEFVYDPDGQPLTTTFMDYLLPSMTDVPPLEVHHLETPSPFTPYGMKGMGEAGAIGPMAAIGNAVTDALGLSVTETPLRMGRVWELIQGESRSDFTDEDLTGFWEPEERSDSW